MIDEVVGELKLLGPGLTLLLLAGPPGLMLSTRAAVVTLGIEEDDRIRSELDACHLIRRTRRSGGRLLSGLLEM